MKEDIKKTSETYTLTLQGKENKQETISGDAIGLTYQE